VEARLPASLWGYWLGKKQSHPALPVMRLIWSSDGAAECPASLWGDNIIAQLGHVGVKLRQVVSQPHREAGSLASTLEAVASPWSHLPHTN